MHISLQTLLLIVVALIAIFALLQITGRATGKTLLRPGRRTDHGAHIARRHGHDRSPHWARVAKEHLLREPHCVACGYKGGKLQVHHIKPFHLHPQLELDPHNLITLCEARGREHHLLLGHLGEWGSYNEHIREDVKHFYRKTAAQIRADLHWQKKMTQRP